MLTPKDIMETELLNESESLDQNESWIPPSTLTSEDFKEEWKNGDEPDYREY